MLAYSGSKNGLDTGDTPGAAPLSIKLNNCQRLQGVARVAGVAGVQGTQ